MIKTLLSKLGIDLSSPLLIACIVLSSLLAGSVYIMHFTSQKNVKLEKELQSLNESYDSLIETVDDMTIELRQRPKEYIEITRDVYTELCHGEILGESVLSLPPITITAKPEQTEQNIGARDEKAEYVDIDGLLPDSLKRLLQ